MKYYLIIPTSLLIVIAVFIFLAANQPKPGLLSPVPPFQTQSAAAEPQKSLFYYINASQELLNKARVLAADTQQTPEEKQEILNTINLALDIITKGIAIYPNDDRALAQRAAIYEATIPINADSRKMAVLNLVLATEINSQNLSHLQRLANLYLQSSDFDSAAKIWYKAHLLNPVDIQIIYDLADALEKSGQTTQASYYFQKLISLLPQNDANLATLKERQQRLGPVTQHTEPIGIEDLPLEQANSGQNLIIAGASSTSEVKSADTSEVSTNSKSGEAVLPANETEVTVKTPLVRDDAFIYIKATSETQNKVIYVSAKGPGYFKVSIDSPVDFEIKFNWWIIN